MDQIDVPVSAYMLALYPALSQAGGRRPGGTTLRPLSLGLAAPSFWSREAIDRAFT